MYTSTNDVIRKERKIHQPIGLVDFKSPVDHVTRARSAAVQDRRLKVRRQNCSFMRNIFVSQSSLFKLIKSL